MDTAAARLGKTRGSSYLDIITEYIYKPTIVAKHFKTEILLLIFWKLLGGFF